MTGTLALIGGGEFTAAAAIEIELVAAAKRAGADRVVVLPTAAAYEHPERAVATAFERFAALGMPVEGLMVLQRPDALDPAIAELLRTSRFTYLAGGSPMHLRSVLKDTPSWDAIVEGIGAGGVLAGSSAGAMVLTEPMIDPRGGAFTLGLGLVLNVAVIPHAEQWSHERLNRTIQLAPATLLIAAVPTGGAIVRDLSDGRRQWRLEGDVALWQAGQPADMDAFPV